LASPKVETIYTLRATSLNGCVATDNMVVFILKAPVIPNAFSPNGDGINDTWNITYLNSYPGCTVDVFDRYGQPVFRSEGYEVPWNGTLKGKQLGVGVYYYIINPKNGLKPVSGSVTILR
jgi:gliding motility-associated-like protein